MLWTTIGIAILLSGLAAGVYIGIPTLIELFMRRNFLKTIQKSGVCCITFDDGPDPRSTPEILRLLNLYKAKATFYMIGKNARAYPDIVKAVIEGGHEIGEHSYAHSFAWLSDPFRTASDFIKGSQALRAYGIYPTLFRPPYGKVNLITLIYMVFSRKAIAWWNLDPRDYTRESSREIVDEVISRGNPGSVILLHDGRMQTETSPRITTEALEEILRHFSGKNIPMITVSQALAMATAPIPSADSNSASDGGASAINPHTLR